jgi:hypothetical protein
MNGKWKQRVDDGRATSMYESDVSTIQILLSIHSGWEFDPKIGCQLLDLQCISAHHS